MAVKKISARIIHRYLGFFLAGIMFVYGLSGVVLIYRTTDVFKIATPVEKTLKSNLNEAKLGQTLKIKRFKIDSEDESFIYFKKGKYHKETGLVNYTRMDLPLVLDKMEHMHKATTNSPLYWLNILFGASLVFFALSTFWMFIPKSKSFRVGLRYSIAGVALTFVLLLL